jgi:hypothetical protein
VKAKKGYMKGISFAGNFLAFKSEKDLNLTFISAYGASSKW